MYSFAGLHKNWRYVQNKLTTIMLLLCYKFWTDIINRGGVEDTRLEAKAKDRPSRGQGQGPRTQTQVFSKKKVFKIFFSGHLYLRKPKKRSLQSFRKVFWRFPTKFQRFKNSAVLEMRTGQFSRAWGFEAKAKDFKMCPRDQGRPQGLHFWLLTTLPFDKKWLLFVKGVQRKLLGCIRS